MTTDTRNHQNDYVRETAKVLALCSAWYRSARPLLTSRECSAAEDGLRGIDNSLKAGCCQPEDKVVVKEMLDIMHGFKATLRERIKAHSVAATAPGMVQ